MDSETDVSSGWLTSLAVTRVGVMVVRIPTDSETAVSSGWLTSLAVTRVGVMVVRIPTEAEKVVSLGWLTNLAVMRAVRMARQRLTVHLMDAVWEIQ